LCHCFPRFPLSKLEETKNLVHLVIFSGGSAFNPTSAYLCNSLPKESVEVSYVIPTTDDGGSTYEIIRYFGGPAIGDFRSRLLRLARHDTDEARAVRRLLEHRLGNDRAQVEEEWQNLVNGSHQLTANSSCYLTTILAFLKYFNESVISQGARFPELGSFDWRNGSIGNFFFTGARLFFTSLDAAIFWWGRVAQIPANTTVLPAVQYSLWDSKVKPSSLTLGAVLTDSQGSSHLILGQSRISHPVSDSSAQYVTANMNNVAAVGPRSPDSMLQIKHSSGFTPFGDKARIERLFFIRADSKQEVNPSD
jgi:hypothetical protein